MGAESEPEAVAAEFSEGETVERRRQRRVLDEIFFSDDEEVSDDSADGGQAREDTGPRRSERVARRNKGAGRISPEF